MLRREKTRERVAPPGDATGSYASRGQGRRVFACSIVAALALLGAASPAHAYRTAADHPDYSDTKLIRWATNEVHFNIDSSWFPSGLDRSAMELAARAAFAAWSRPDCAAVEFLFDGFTESGTVSGDGVVTLRWMSTGWASRDGTTPAAATTEVLYERDRQGRWRISDADVFLAGEGFVWSVEASVGEGARDVATVLVHEVGHVLGFSHVCESDGFDSAPVCTDAHQTSVMHPDYRGVEQRALDADHAQGVCDLYALSSCAQSGCAAGQQCTYEGCAVVCDAELCGVGERCSPTGCTTRPCEPGSCERGCADTTCAEGPKPDGDPCSNGKECYSGHCSSVGQYCTRTCAHDALSCGDEYACDASVSPAECIPQRGVVGSACHAPQDCQERLCLTGAGPVPMCTRACGEGEARCPDGYACETVEGTSVCAPVVSSAGEGCTTVPGASQRSGWGFLGLLGVVALVWSHRRLARET